MQGTTLRGTRGRSITIPVVEKVPRRRLPAFDSWAILLVTGAALMLAGVEYVRFLESPRTLWYSAEHDRNAHYFNGLSLAIDLRHLDVRQIRRDLDSHRVWGPLHAIVSGTLMAMTGPDVRVAVLPSLAAWLGTVLLGFLIARRSVTSGGTWAGLTAALFIVASPAYRAFAVDIMLESLGAFLSLLVLYCYVVMVQDRSAKAARSLGLALTALFLLKYNYWLLMLLPLLVVELAARRWTPVTSVAWSRLAWLGHREAAKWSRGQWRHPLNYLLALVVVLFAVVVLSGGTTLHLAGHTISVRTGENLLHLAYVLLFVRALPWWWRTGWAWVQQLEFPMPQLFAWHVLPVALWFLWPKRLGYFFWYLTRNHGDEVAEGGWLSSVAYYWEHLGQDYHVASWSLFAAAGLFVVALLSCRKLRPGGAAVLCVFLFAAFLAIRYPSHRSRFLHSWLAAGWVVAGIGLAEATTWVPALRGRAGAGLTALAVALLALLHLPGTLHSGHAPEGGPAAAKPTLLELSDRYLPALADARHPAILSNEPIKFFMLWTYLERYGRRAPIDIALHGDTTAAEFPEAFARWLHSVPCDMIVHLDFPRGSRLYEGADVPGYDQVPTLLAARSDFVLVERQDYPQYGCGATIWRRK